MHARHPLFSISSRPAVGVIALMTVSVGAMAWMSPARHSKTPPKPSPSTKARASLLAKPTVTESQFNLKEGWKKHYALKAGQVVEINIRLLKPSLLPANGRVSASWSLEGEAVPTLTTAREYGISAPTAGWRKILHAHDGDLYMVYRAPSTGNYLLTLEPLIEEKPVGEQGVRWREKGNAPRLASLPEKTPWNPGTVAPMSVAVTPLSLGTAQETITSQAILEQEPNDTPEMAQTITLNPGTENEVKTWEVTGGADDIEFFDNGRVGASGDDWYAIDYKGAEPRLLTAQISMPSQAVVARVRAYRIKAGAKATNGVLPIEEAKEGQDGNERVHQQDEEHRSNICRLLKPGEHWYLRVEANTPGYQLQLRLLKPAPYTDPHMAIRQAIYTQIGQVDAWLTNRPRGASVERRIRDSGNLLGTQCMSCHTQSGVWGPAVPVMQGYTIENPQNYWHLVNTMYECLRPTNELKDAANNTSLAPLDIGDGPAGTRAAGFNIVQLERIRKPSLLHSRQQVRTANYVLLTADPGGINAAGPGSNIGFVVVNLFATEILKTAWEKAASPQYFRGMEQKAHQVLEVVPQFTDDVALRLHYFRHVFPIRKYKEWATRADLQESSIAKGASAEPKEPAKNGAEIGKARDLFVEQVEAKLKEDEARLRSLQTESGAWGFHPGTLQEGGKTWRRVDNSTDPSPTALALLALNSNGYGTTDPAIEKGVHALLKMQDASGRWNRAAQTGFVTTAYALHALSRLYPMPKREYLRADYMPKPNETLLQTLHRIQSLALIARPELNAILLQSAKHPNPAIRYWAMIGLGANRKAESVPALVLGLSDSVKMVRNAATWGLREELLNDHGWEEAFRAYEKGDDYTREQVVQALNMRADATSTRTHVDWSRLTSLLDRAMNLDPHPAVRSWASKAAWQWWVWNPPSRNGINTAWVKMLERSESDMTTENSNRYSSQALFIANGHKANGSTEHQYKELTNLFETLTKHLQEQKDPTLRLRLATRIVGIGGTFFETSGGDGGPGQMGYVTPGSGEMMGLATLVYLNQTTQHADLAAIRAGLEGGSNVPYPPLNQYLVEYSLKGPEELRQLAAAAISDPRSVSLQAVPEQVEPQMVQVRRGAGEPARRPQISDPILNLWARVNWIIPKTEEQQRNFFNIIIPKFETYASPEELAQMTDAVKKSGLERQLDADWYLSDRLGEVLQRNPDLHQEIVFRNYFPATFRNALEEHFWLRSVEWLLTFSTSVQKAQAETRLTSLPQDKSKDKPDEALSIKDRALQLFLDALKPTANPRTRAIAIRMSNQTALRTNPEVLARLSEVLQYEKDRDLRGIVENVLRQGNEKFVPDLMEALKEEKHSLTRFDNAGNPIMTPELKQDVLYFRDYVMPELSRQKRLDQQSCLGCHGVVGRVPSFYMRPPDKFGYIPVKDLLFDYRTMQGKIRLDNIEKSKILRKPLNIQDGKEDGHQGGRRYSPSDPGYLVLRKWVENQVSLLKPNTSAFEKRGTVPEASTR